MATRTLTLLSEATGKPLAEMDSVSQRFPFAISTFLRNRVLNGEYAPEALRQFLPDARELWTAPGYTSDPTGESELHPEPSILHVYGNRLALILTYRCLVYCRFCFRKHVVGFGESRVPAEDIERGIAYVEAHPEISDILLSGGDPLAISNAQLLPLLRRLVEIPHLKVIRIDSRALNAMPERFDDELLDFFSAHPHFWYYAHLNHPDDVDHPDVLAAARRLRAAGVPIYNQCVLLRGVNDRPQTLRRLMELCYVNKILPYNLYVLDRVEGATHFALDDSEVASLYRSLADLSGPAQPLLVYVGNDSKKRRMTNSDIHDIHAFLRARHRELAAPLPADTRLAALGAAQ